MGITTDLVAAEAMNRFTAWLNEVNILLAPVEHCLVGVAKLHCQYDPRTDRTQFLVACRVGVYPAAIFSPMSDREWTYCPTDDGHWEARCHADHARHAPCCRWMVRVDETVPPAVRAAVVTKGAIPAFDHYFTGLIEPHLKRWSETHDHRHA